MGIQDNFWTIGEEAVAWGTKAATLTRGIENQTDDATPNIEHMQSRGMRPATVATPTGRSVAVPRGGQHVVTLDLMNKSLGLIFAGVASTVATTTWIAAMPPLVIQALVPLSTHSSVASSYLALVRSDETSEPASGSDTQKAPSAIFSGVP